MIQRNELTSKPISTLLKLNTHEATQECEIRDILRDEFGGDITISKSSIDDASLFLLRQYMQFSESRIGCTIGLASWLKIQAKQILTDLSAEVDKNTSGKIKLKSLGLYWTFLLNKQIDKGPTLLGIKVGCDDKIILTRDPRKPNIKIHAFNRLSTRALHIYIEQGLSLGMNISEFIYSTYLKAKVISRSGNKLKLRYDSLNYILIKTPLKSNIVTVLI